MQNKVTEEKYHGLSDDAYRISERSVKEKRENQWPKCKKTTKKSNLGCLFYLFSKKKVTRIIITIL